MMHHFTSVITKEKKWYVAYCVELGVASQGKTIKTAQKNLKEAVILYLENSPSLRTMLPKEVPLVSTFKLEHV